MCTWFQWRRDVHIHSEVSTSRPGEIGGVSLANVYRYPHYTMWATGTTSSTRERSVSEVILRGQNSRSFKAIRHIGSSLYVNVRGHVMGSSL